MLKLDANVHFPIADVTVFEDRGEVTRKGEAQLPAGESVVVLQGVSALFDPLRATVRSDAEGVRVDEVSVEYRRVVLGSTQVDRTAALSEEGRGFKRALQRAEVEFEAAEAERDACLQLFREWTDRIGEPLFYAADKGVDLAAGYAAARERLDANRTRYESVVKQMTELKKQISDVKELLRAAGETPSGPLVADIHLRLSAPSAGVTPLRVAYVIPCAVWRPAHEVETNAEETRWRSLGTVWQASGEAWENVALRLSTERPNVSTQLPALSPDVLTLREKTEEEKRVIRVQHRAETASKDQGGRGVPGVNDGGQARFFTVVGEVTIQSNGMPHQVHVDEFPLEARRRTVARPRHAAAAFDLLHLTHRPGMPLLAGPVTLMEDGAFAGRDTIGFVGSGEPFDVCFGRDRRVQVRRNLFRVDQERRLLSNIRHFICSAEIRSLAASAVDLTVEFEIPVSEVKQVKVIASESHCTHGASTPDENGHVKFAVTVAPGQTLDVTYGFHFDTSGEVNIPDPW